VSQHAGRPERVGQGSTGLVGPSCALAIPDRLGHPSQPPLPPREGEAQRRRGLARWHDGRVREGQADPPGRGGLSGRASQGPLPPTRSPRRSSTAHTSARRPPGAGAARSGALQARPARRSRACTYSRPSALAWATSSLSVGERSKASMISAAKTEERRSTSMTGTRAGGAAPVDRQTALGRAHPAAPPQAGEGEAGEARRRGMRAAGAGHGRPHRVRPDRSRPRAESGRTRRPGWLGAALGKGRGGLRVTSSFVAQAFYNAV
jgi:hypothetical protein